MAADTLDGVLASLNSKGVRAVSVDDATLFYQGSRVLIEIRDSDNPVLKFALKEIGISEVDKTRPFISLAVPDDSLPLELKTALDEQPYVALDHGNKGTLCLAYAAKRDELVAGYANGSLTLESFRERFRREAKPEYDSMMELWATLMPGLIPCHPSQLETLPG